jgi:hypothetical protein
MKTFKILSVMIALAVSVIMGQILTGIFDAELTVSGVNLLPFGISALLFGGSFLPITPQGSLFIYVATSVEKPGQNAGRGGNMKDEIIFFDMDTVDTFPALDDKSIVRSGDITFLNNAYMITIYGTNGTLENTSTIEGETDNKGFLQSSKFKHPGSAKEIREFKANWYNRNIGIIHRRCDSTDMDLYGEPCNPLQMMVANWKQNKDENSTEFEFKSVARGNEVSIYTGTLTFDSGSGSGS